MIPEEAAYETVKAAIEAAAEGDTLHGAEHHATTEETITKDKGVRVSDADADLAPLRGVAAMGVYDAVFCLVVFSRVKGSDKSKQQARRAARTSGWELALAVAKVFQDDPRMGGQVLNSRLLRGRAGYDSISNADEYYVVLLPMIVNETGRRIESNEVSLQTR